MSSEITINLEAWEADVLRDMEPSQAGRVQKILRLLTKLYNSGLSNRPETIIGFRLQNFFLNTDVEEIERALVGIYRYAKPEDIELMTGMLEWREITITEHNTPRKVPGQTRRSLNTRKGRIVF